MGLRVTDDGVVQNTESVPVEEIMFGDYLEREFIKHSERIAMIDTETGLQYTYGELLDVVKSISAALQIRGVKRNDIVVLCATTSVKACCYVLALAFCQAVMVMAKPYNSVYELKDVLQRFPSLELILGDSVSTSNLRQATSVDVLNLEEVWDPNIAAEFRHPGEADPRSTVMWMCFTSGSTGPPKTVCISHYVVLGDRAQWRSSFARHLMCIPVSQLTGNLCLALALAESETLLIAPEQLKNDIPKYLDVCSKWKVESALTMPVLLTSLTKFGATHKLTSVKRFFTGGSAIPQPLIDEFSALHPHIRVYNLFGLSESGVILESVDQSDVGRLAPFPNVEVKIVDLNTNETLGPNRNGMLYVRAPTLALGYFENEEATQEAFVDGWLVTGDLAHRDEEGCVIIVDRLKQMIKCMDLQVAPAELEQVLSRSEDVLKVLVGGVPHESFGETAVAFVVPRETSNLAGLRMRLIESVESKLAFYKHLHGGLFFVDSIPETDSGKFSRKDIVSKHLGKQIKYLD